MIGLFGSFAVIVRMEKNSLLPDYTENEMILWNQEKQNIQGLKTVAQIL